MFENVTFAVNLVGRFDVAKGEIQALTNRLLISSVLGSNGNIVVGRKVLDKLKKKFSFFSIKRK